MTTLLLREKMLVRLDTLIFHAEALQRLKAEVTALKAVGAGRHARPWTWPRSRSATG